jgi:hypothetical protein
MQLGSAPEAFNRGVGNLGRAQRQETKMRRSAIIAAAATAITASAASFTPAQAAPVNPMPIVGELQNGTIEQVRHRSRHHGGGWRHGHHHRRHYDRGFSSFSFSFGFPYYAPYAYYPRYRPYYGYGDCFITWDGQTICR